jgi:hypothetical protein
MDQAALPAGASHDRTNGLLAADVSVRDDQLDALEAARAFRLRRKAVQKAPSWESPTSRPKTSRPPSAVTPVAITTARLTTRPSTRALR